ncbi:MAG: CRISPR-associated endonuclease Cas6 [Methanosarcinales archaeon]
MKESPEKLRGYIGNRFKEYPLLHHHPEEGLNLYQYPRVQYKIIGGTPIILGIEEGVEVLRETSGDLEELVLGKTVYQIEEKQTIERKQEFKVAGELKQYCFATPWLALNEKNYKTYLQTGTGDRVNLLHHILVGNLLSISKSMGYVVLEKVKVRTNVRPVKVRSKGIPLLGFTGEFQANFLIPEYLGLGRSVSRGFGVVVGKIHTGIH